MVWPPSRWRTVVAPPVWPFIRRATSKGGIAAVARMPRTMPLAHANGPCPGAITAGTILLTFSPMPSITASTGEPTMMSLPSPSTSKNGLLTLWGYNATHGVPQLTVEDYVTSRYILKPLRIRDCDRPVQASAAYLFTTAERARNMRQQPVYILNHTQHEARQRSTQASLDEIEAETDRVARMMWEGSGLGPQDVDILNPYDGYSIMTQFWLEAFQRHGVKRGEVRLLCGRH